eukprot:1119287-Lingulodinium_polyedra.AAC.1
MSPPLEEEDATYSMDFAGFSAGEESPAQFEYDEVRGPYIVRGFFQGDPCDQGSSSHRTAV